MAEAESSGHSKHVTSRQVRTGRLYMIDLAGSERAANTKVTLPLELQTNPREVLSFIITTGAFS